LQKAPYLLATWHPTTRPDKLDLDGDEAWVQLRVLACSTQGDAATVEFIGRARRGGHVASMHEVSRFVRESGRWFYLDGTIKGA
jgi:SEC-C motif-containing protein